MNPNDLTGAVVDAAIKVHRALGPGLLESAYQACLAFELRDRDLLVETEVPLPVVYRDVQLEVGYRIDLLVENQVIVELKSVDSLLPIHQAQVLSYMKMSNKKVGLLINFNVTLLKDGVRRLVKNF
ncbi:MAG: GxxExxY protein [Planctomycetales bacterium]|nr:GxxExxY protein [Planctomycetales bacterium]